jgi:large subunit ribosomal protein L21
LTLPRVEGILTVFSTTGDGALYAIIESGGKQFRVTPDGRVRVPSLAGEPGDRVTFDRVLLASDGGTLRPGSPVIEGARVVGEIVRHGRAKKIVVFTFKRRHRFRRKRGHRQGFTEVAIREIALGGRGSGGDGGVTRAARVDTSAGGAETGAPREAEAPGGAFPCVDCGRTFASERGLQQHRSKSH